MIIALRISKGERVKGTIQLARPMHAVSARAMAREWQSTLGPGWVVALLDDAGMEHAS